MAVPFINNPTTVLDVRVALPEAQQACAYCMLQMWDEATEEFDRMPYELQAHSEVLELRLLTWAGRAEWKTAADIAESMVGEWNLPTPTAFFVGADALRHTRGPDAAVAHLEKGKAFIADNPALYYNLACYEAVRGNVEIARAYINQACDLEETKTVKIGLRELARTEPDLQALW